MHIPSPFASRSSAPRRTVSLRRPAAARLDRTPLARGVRGGFTLLEMLIATTLVLLMMLLFAQVFGLATETVHIRKGMAANDQKARLLTTRIDNDLSARTFRTVVPFPGTRFAYRFEKNDVNGDGAIDGWVPDYDHDGEAIYLTNTGAGLAQVAEGVKGSFDDRRGYFSISENDPFSDQDDVLSITINGRLVESRAGVSYSPARGRAAVLYPNAQVAGGVPVADQPATDSYNTSGATRNERFGANPLGNTSSSVSGYANSVLQGTSPVGVSNYEIVTFFLRDGNLVRARKLIREPETDHNTLWDRDGDGEPDPWPPTDGSISVGGVNYSFGQYFDYAAFSHPGTLVDPPTVQGPRFHSANSLVNEAGDAPIRVDFDGDGLFDIDLPESLGNPYLREGAGFFPFSAFNPSIGRPFGRPREFLSKTRGPELGFDASGALTSSEWGTGFLGRFLATERSQPNFNLPGRRAILSPTAFDPATGVGGGPLFAPAGDLKANGILNGGGSNRRGEEILLSNVHGFDIEVYDDAIGDFVDLGHTRTVPAPDIFDTDGDGDVTELINVAGDYHADRLIAVTPTGAAALDVTGTAAGEADYNGDGAPDPHPFGNRFDTWHPEMSLMNVGYIDDGAGGFTPISLRRPYPPPYRPLRNPLGGDVGVPTRDAAGNRIAYDLTFGGTGLVTAEDLNGGANLATMPVTTLPLLNAATDGFLDPDLPIHTRPAVGGSGDYYAKAVTTPGEPARLFPSPNAYGEPGSGDEKPLRAVRITVRFYDVQGDQMREESFRHSLID